MDEKSKFLKAWGESLLADPNLPADKRERVQASLDMLEAASNPAPLTDPERKEASAFLIEVSRYAKQAGDVFLAVGYALNARLARLEALFTGRTIN